VIHRQLPAVAETKPYTISIHAVDHPASRAHDTRSEHSARRRHEILGRNAALRATIAHNKNKTRRHACFLLRAFADRRNILHCGCVLLGSIANKKTVRNAGEE
jgi:hypothetical protein